MTSHKSNLYFVVRETNQWNRKLAIVIGRFFVRFFIIFMAIPRVYIFRDKNGCEWIMNYITHNFSEWASMWNTGVQCKQQQQNLNQNRAISVCEVNEIILAFVRFSCLILTKWHKKWYKLRFMFCRCGRFGKPQKCSWMCTNYKGNER